MSERQASNEPPAWEPRSVQLGEWRATALCDGFLRLDGGSMWGVVPANLWRRMTPPLEDNTILLALRPFLLERGEDKVLLEVGVGDRWTEKQRAIYHLLPTTPLEEALAACGVTPEEVTHVIASHCHWDHVGHMVVEKDGELAVKVEAKADAPAFSGPFRLVAAEVPGEGDADKADKGKPLRRDALSTFVDDKWRGPYAIDEFPQLWLTLPPAKEEKKDDTAGKGDKPAEAKK